MRDSEFKESEEHLIDIFDIKVCPPILFFLSFIIFFFSIIEGILKGQLYICIYPDCQLTLHVEILEVSQHH